MKTIVRGGAVLAAALFVSAASASDAIYGVWQRDGQPDQMEFFDCGGKLCGKGHPPPADGSPPPQVLRNASKTSANSWSGDLINPEDGKMYKGTITLESPTTLTLKGCLVAFLCQSEGWTRISGPTKPAAHDAKAASPEKPAGHDVKSGQISKDPAHDAKAHDNKTAKPKP
ncbi:MAG: DUF2147 domain-containing protein [Methylocystis sp.]|nr:DUF2147 domain-containing protein [Methylocystis sp.]